MRKENQNIEWKESWHDDYLKWLCGFANAQGGRLVIGKNDRGKVVGLANAETLLEDLPNKIRVYEDRIRFYNDGCLPEGWTVKKLLRKHKSAPHNPLIAGTFFRTGDIEAWGRGIDTIRTACMEHGSDFPTFESEPTSMMVEFKGVLPTDTRVEGAVNVRDKSGKDSGSTAQEMIPETPGKTRVETLGKTLGKTPGKIAALLLQEPHMTVAEIASAISRSESAVQRAIFKLQKAGELRRVGSRKSGHWDVSDKGNSL